jgi:hypothetical protein
MRSIRRIFSSWNFVFLIGLAMLPAVGHSVELRMSREALDRTLKQQLFSGPQGRYYLKGDARSACSVWAEKPELSFVGDRVVVKVKTHARLGTGVAGKCIGVSLSPTAEVSMVPDAEGETIGFRDAKVERVSDSKELNFLLLPFLSHQIPASMKINAADVLRKSLAGSVVTTGYAMTLDRLKVHSMTISTGPAGDWLVVDVDGDVSVR